jgi:NitT/TauT family transport system ATP-binding protein
MVAVADPVARVGAATSVLDVNGVGKSYGAGPAAQVAIADISFSVGKGEFVSIVGPSGCGKTTLIKLIAGLMKPSGGTIRLFDQQVVSVPKDLSVVFQDYSRSLFPWLRVASNVAFPLKSLPIATPEREQRVHAALEAVGLAAHKQKYPWELSGGMQQRVALARAIACQPRLLLMDEPFASVDAQTRADLEDLTLKVHRDLGMTTLFITHDIDESVYLANRVIVLGHSPGRVLAEVVIDLPATRDQIATKELDAFVRLRAEVARLVRAAARGDASAFQTTALQTTAFQTQGRD